MRDITEKSKEYCADYGFKTDNDVSIQDVREAYENGYTQCIETVIEFLETLDLDDFEDAIHKLHKTTKW